MASKSLRIKKQALIKPTIIICMIGIGLFFDLASAVSGPLEENIFHLYIGGFVLNKQTGEGVPGANIIFEHENEKLFDIQTTDAGWFESNQPISKDLIEEKIRLTVMKFGFQVISKIIVLKRSDNYITMDLEPLQDVFSVDSKRKYPTGVLYGQVLHPLSRQPIPGAKISLLMEDEPVDISFSRDSGYFTINYPMKYEGHTAIYRIEHPKYEVYKKKITIDQENRFIQIDRLKEKLFEVDWLIREGIIYDTNRPAQDFGSYSPFKFQINFLKVIKLALKENTYESLNMFEWSFGVAYHNTKGSDLSIVQPGFSWKPWGEKYKIVFDFAAGVALIEDNKDEEHYYSPHFQLNISRYFPRPKEFRTVTPHFFFEISTFREDDVWKTILGVGVGI